jgi:Holliday junction resolvasome RuvABC DNA-binding subunit
MNDKDAVIVYLNAAEPKHQPTVKADDVEALLELGFKESEEGEYTVYALY